MLQKKYTISKSEHQVRLICDSYAQVIAVTIKHTLQLRSMTYFLVWQLRSIRRNFLIPISTISDPAAAVSHTQKINWSHDSLHAQYGRRTRCRVDTIRECLNSPCSASAILIDRNCAWPLPTRVQPFIQTQIKENIKAFVQGIHRGPVNSPHKWPVTRKMLQFDDVIMSKI